MKKSITIIVALFGACLSALVFVRISNAAKLSAKESSQRALIVEAQILLEDQYVATKRYPESLKELKLTYPDGGSPALLADFIYMTDGKSYSLEFTGVSSKQLIQIHNDHSKTEPNKAPEPTTMVVTPPAAQEPRQP